MVIPNISGLNFLNKSESKTKKSRAGRHKWENKDELNRIVLKYLKKHKEITANKVKSVIGTGDKTANDILNYLESKGIVRIEKKKALSVLNMIVMC